MLHFTLLTHLTNSQRQKQQTTKNLSENPCSSPFFISMAPQNKITSNSRFVYQLNNFATCVNTTDAPQEFHSLIQFLSQCSLSYAIIATLILFCEVVDEVWSTAVNNVSDKVITFNLKGNSYSINGDVLNASLNLPANTHAKSPSEVDIKKMLNEINYSTPNANLGKNFRKNLRNEWSYFFDSLIKVFSEKISNFDAITSVIQEIVYGVLYNHFHDLGELLIIEIGTSLGNIKSRSKNIYYARFIMLIANHVVPNLIVDQNENQLVCWV